MTARPVAIVDIGSNSVRLVVYANGGRSPAIVFNEKVMAGLGKGAADDSLDEAAMERALAALRRFRLLCRQMGAGRIRVVATAAVREASNGDAFLERVRQLGLDAEMLSGEQEAEMAALGVLSAIPEADGIVGDLGGGSLELVEVADGAIGAATSLPLGVLRVGSDQRRVLRTLVASGVADWGRRRPLYLVGGSWRALAKLDMALTGYPLPITHHYEIAPERLAEIGRVIAGNDRLALKGIADIASSRAAVLPQAQMLLATLAETLRPSRLIVSSYGIREGLLFDALPARVRRKDPLIEAARDTVEGLGRFDEHGDLLDRWIAPAFDDDSPALARLRHAACLLADVAWRANPDFRAERGVEMALHGNWVGIDGPGRVLLAQALFANFGGSGSFADTDLGALCDSDALARAEHWGYAMRLGQRLGGGVAESLERSRLRLDEDGLVLELKRRDAALYGEAVERRHKLLAAALGTSHELALI